MKKITCGAIFVTLVECKGDGGRMKLGCRVKPLRARSYSQDSIIKNDPGVKVGMELTHFWLTVKFCGSCILPLFIIPRLYVCISFCVCASSMSFQLWSTKLSAWRRDQVLTSIWLVGDQLCLAGGHDQGQGGQVAIVVGDRLCLAVGQVGQGKVEDQD